MIAVANLSKQFGAQTLFEGVSVQFNPGERYGVVGANGSGKSTLLSIISGEEPPSGGDVAVPKRIRLGVLKQDHFRYEEDNILDVVMMGNATLWQAMVEKEELLEVADESFDADRYAVLEDVILRHDGYSLEARAGEILEGLGIPSEQHHQALSTLSGGFKLRVLLAQMLASDPDVLLLDEPTNHLDILSIRWLEKFLIEFKGCSLVVSHDHRFLDNVCTSIIDVDYETAMLYPGNYSDFDRAKNTERNRREQEIGRRERQIADHQAFVDRFRAKASKARQAQSKIKLIEKIVIDRLPQTSRRYPKFRFQQVRPSGKQVLEIQDIHKSYGENSRENKVLEGVSLNIQRADRLAIIGPNGIGKSTLLKIVMGAVEADRGTVEWGYETHPGYFAQDFKDQLGDGRQTVEAWLWDLCPAEPIGFVRGKLGQVLFSKDEVKKKVASLSGGEASRLIFSRQMVEEPNVLVLDEPTNHLDLEAIEALVKALKEYPGTLIFVSHDRWFVAELATRILEITPAGLTDFAGTYPEYLESCGDDHLDSETVLLKARREKRRAKNEKKKPKSGNQQDRRLKQLNSKRDQLTTELERAEARVHSINESFCNPMFFDKTPRKEVEKLEQEQRTLTTQIDQLMADWQGVEEELAALGE